jgi:hypothetical protein
MRRIRNLKMVDKTGVRPAILAISTQPAGYFALTSDLAEGITMNSKSRAFSLYVKLKQGQA